MDFDPNDINSVPDAQQVIDMTTELIDNFNANAEKLPDLWLKCELYETLIEFRDSVRDDLGNIKEPGFNDMVRISIKLNYTMKLTVMDDLVKYYMSRI